MADLGENFRINERAASLASHLILVVMLVCVMLSLMQLIGRLSPTSDIGFLPWLTMIISGEAILSQRIMRRKSNLEVNELVYRLVEGVVLLLVIKIFIYLWRGYYTLAADLPGLRQHFLQTFFSGEFIVVVGMLLLVWAAATMFASDLMELEGDESLLTLTDHYMSNRAAIRQQLVNRVLALGVIILLATAVVRMDIRFIWGDRPASRAGLGSVLVYFLFGLALLSLTHFSVRRASWAWYKLPVKPEIARRWVWSSLALLAAATLLAFLLPTSYTLGFLSTLRYLISVVWSLLLALLILLMTPFYLLFGWLSRLLGGGQPQTPPPVPTMPPPTAAQPPPGPPPPWLDLMKSVVFWGVLAAVVIFAIYQYARQNKELFARIRRAPLMSWLFDAWHWLQNRVRGASRDLRQAVRQGLQRLREAGRPVVGGFSRRFANPRRLPPRERVRFFYLALVRKGQDAGLPRRPYQTPNEYAASLQQNLPEMDEDIHPLTEAFIEARYTRHPVSEAQAGLARRSWERLRRILRRQPHH